MIKLKPNFEEMLAKEVDFFDYQKILIPLHLKNKKHWTLCEIDLQEHCLRFYDSQGKDGMPILNDILSYLQQAHLAIRKEKLDVSKFKLENAECPQQTTKTDCGIFVIAVADHLATNSKLTFSQNDISSYRLAIRTDIQTNCVELARYFDNGKLSLRKKTRVLRFVSRRKQCTKT